MPTEDELEQRLLENLGLINNEEQNETKANKTKGGVQSEQDSRLQK